MTSTRAAENGIIPFDGQRMLRFEWADTVSQASSYAGSQLFQLVSVPSGGLVTATAVFNRVAGDSETDTKFNLVLDFFSGAPSSYPSVANDPLDRAIVEFFTDSDPLTWELATVSFVAPAGSTYVALQLSAGEDVFNDTSGIEFDGHYADAVTLEIIPEPSTAPLLALGLIGLSAQRRSARATVPRIAGAARISSRRARAGRTGRCAQCGCSSSD